MLRRLVGRYRNKRKAHGKQPGVVVASPSKAGDEDRGLASAAWRLIVALQRYVGVQKAMRLAKSGAIVITHRWPQNMEPGILDGPSVLAPGASWPRLLLSAIERHIYRRMERFEPSLTIPSAFRFRDVGSSQAGRDSSRRYQTAPLAHAAHP